MKSNSAVFLGLVIAVGLAIALVLGRGRSTSAPRPVSIESSSSSETPRPSRPTNTNRQAASAFSLEKLGGGLIALVDYRDKKPVIVDFWATWCPNCRRDLPHMNALYQTYKDKVEVIAINLQEDSVTVARFVQDQGLAFPVALDPKGEATLAYGVRYTNLHVLVDKAGNLVRTVPGDIREKDFQELAAGS